MQRPVLENTKHELRPVKPSRTRKPALDVAVPVEDNAVVRLAADSVAVQEAGVAGREPKADAVDLAEKAGDAAALVEEAKVDEVDLAGEVDVVVLAVAVTMPRRFSSTEK